MIFSQLLCELHCKALKSQAKEIVASIVKGSHDINSLDRRMSGLYYALLNLQNNILDELDEELGLDIIDVLLDYGPIIVQWMQVISKKNEEWIENALQEDKVTALDGSIKCSTSVVDIFYAFNSTVSLLEKLEFPDDQLNAVFCTLLSEMICRGCELYTTRIHQQIHSKGFYDEEGQFDVTEQLCISLNNIEQARVRLDKLKVAIEELMGDVKDTGSDMVIKELFFEAGKYLTDHLNSLLGATVEKMRPDLIRYLNHMTGTADALAGDGIQVPQNVEQGSKFSLFGMRNVSSTENGGSIADSHIEAADAVGPILDYLNTNLETFSEYVFVNIFKGALRLIWEDNFRYFSSYGRG